MWRLRRRRWTSEHNDAQVTALRIIAYPSRPIATKQALRFPVALIASLISSEPLSTAHRNLRTNPKRTNRTSPCVHRRIRPSRALNRESAPALGNRIPDFKLAEQAPQPASFTTRAGEASTQSSLRRLQIWKCTESQSALRSGWFINAGGVLWFWSCYRLGQRAARWEWN